MSENAPATAPHGLPPAAVCLAPPQSVFARWPHLWAIAVAVLFWGALLLAAGTFFTGFQFIDDHDQLRIEADLRAPDASVGQVIREWVTRDMARRFRPLYCVHRVALVGLIGTNWVLWELHQAALAVLTSVLLFAFFRRIGFGWTQAALFPLLALLGPQAAIYWRLGPAETLGMLFLALSLFFMGMSATALRRQPLYEVLFLVSAALAALCKESFLLMLPALAFWRLWLAASPPTMALPEPHPQDMIDLEGPGKVRWPPISRRVWLSASILLVICGTCLCLILALVGSEKSGYAGVGGLRPYDVLACILTVFGRLRLFLVALGLCAVSWFTFQRLHRLGATVRAFTGNLLPPFLLSVFVILPQTVLYAKSGVFERYHLPAAVGVALLLVWLYRHLRLSNLCFARIFLAVILLQTGWHTWNVYRAATEWVGMARACKAFLVSVEEHSDTRSTMLIVADPARNNEEALSVVTYLTLHSGRRLLHCYPVSAPPYTPFEMELIARNELPTWYEGRVLHLGDPAPRFDLIIALHGASKAFLDPGNRPEWFDPYAWEYQTFTGKLGGVIYLPKHRVRSGD